MPSILSSFQLSSRDSRLTIDLKISRRSPFNSLREIPLRPRDALLGWRPALSTLFARFGRGLYSPGPKLPACTGLSTLFARFLLQTDSHLSSFSSLSTLFARFFGPFRGWERAGLRFQLSSRDSLHDTASDRKRIFLSTLFARFRR